jgi:hypothetical protein
VRPLAEADARLDRCEESSDLPVQRVARVELVINGLGALRTQPSHPHDGTRWPPCDRSICELIQINTEHWNLVTMNSALKSTLFRREAMRTIAFALIPCIAGGKVVIKWLDCQRRGERGRQTRPGQILRRVV